MMKPEKVTFYVYAETAEEAQKLQSAMNAFVREQYNRGVLVTATRLTDALEKFGSNMFISNYLKSK